MTLETDQLPQVAAPICLAGPYTLEVPIGTGGRATVYRGRSHQGQVVAVKVLHPESLQDDEIKRFEREYQVLSKLDHPNVIRVLASGVQDGYPWIAMEYVHGPTLEALTDAWRSNPPPDQFKRVEQLFRGVCAALQAVHELGWIHRDVKPCNILVSQDGQAKLGDFGMVTESDGLSSEITQVGQLVGTVAFMAPEIISGETGDHRADLYALGAVLYTMLTLKHPIEATTVVGYLAKHLTDQPTVPSQIDPTVPPHLDRICQRLLSKHPSQRYPSVQAVLQALQHTHHPASPPLRGNHHLLTAWTERLFALSQGTSGLVRVQGPAGSGKRFVVQTLAEQAREQGYQVVFPFHEAAMASLVDSSQTEPTVVVVETPGELANDAFRTLARWLHNQLAQAQAPVLLLYVAAQLAPSLSEVFRGTLSGLPTERLVLEPLSRAHVTAMIRDRGVQGPVAIVLGQRLHQALGGLPSRIHQQLRHLVTAGWLRKQGEHLVPNHAIEVYKQRPLPVPPAIVNDLNPIINRMTPPALRVATALALLDRPIASAQLAQCADHAKARAAVDSLVRSGVLEPVLVRNLHAVQFADPSLGTVLALRLSPEERRAGHRAIASALAKRYRRDGMAEVAHHWQQAGAWAQAYPLYVRAAERAAGQRKPSEVLRWVTQASGIRDAAWPDLLESDRDQWVYRLAVVAGEAYMSKNKTDMACEQFERAVEAAQERSHTARALAGLGRALYRQGQLDQAVVHLQDALSLSEPDNPEYAPVLRALADSAICRGQLDVAQAYWDDALATALTNRNRDAEARARRGVAHVRAVQGLFGDAAAWLRQADDLLNPTGDAHVRSAILARLIELDLVAGRWASARYLCERLVDWVQRAPLPDRLAEASALFAQAQLLSGQPEQAAKWLNQAHTQLGAGGGPAVQLWVARLLCDVGRWAEAQATLPELHESLFDALDDPHTQRMAIMARVAAATDPDRAKSLTQDCLRRPAPFFGLRHARICIDVCAALAHCGDASGAQAAAQRVLKVLPLDYSDGIRLEVLLTLQRAFPSPERETTIEHLKQRLTKPARLPDHITHSAVDRAFDARPAIR